MTTVNAVHTSDTRSAAAYERLLVGAAWFFAFAVLIHNSDHLRRGLDATHKDVVVAGTLAIPLEVAIIALVLARHQLAPLVATVGGYVLALGYFVVHFLPSHPVLSDSFPSAVNLSPMSWVAGSLELTASVAVATAGLMVLRSGAWRGDGDWREGLRHPLSIVMIAGNGIILLASLLTL